MSKVGSWFPTLSVFVSGFVEQRERERELFLGLEMDLEMLTNVRSFVGLVSFLVVERKLTAEVAVEAASMAVVEEKKAKEIGLGFGM